jgi:hypothetical protein
MINEVRNTVLAILNKQNYGYVSPADFNMYAKQAQLDVFEQYFYKYNRGIIMENARQSNTGLADMTKRTQEVIEIFSVMTDPVVSVPTNSYTLPENIFYLNSVRYNKASNRFIDVEKTNRSKLTALLMSNLTQPIDLFPMYYSEGKKIIVYPETINQTGKITLDYVRYPEDPKWTWRNISGGSPVFDPTQEDYMDFELPLSDQTLLVAKILQYAGFEIREDAAVQAGAMEEQKTTQFQN